MQCLSYEAIRWALAQTVEKSSAKFVLVAMADCVNAEDGEMTCWPSYAHLAQVTGQDTKTVEASVCRLRIAGLITDTGARKGSTGKVVAYRLNDPKNGEIKPKGNDPEIPANPPKFPPQSPQISGVTTPKTGGGTRKGTRNEPGKELDARVRALPPQLVEDYLAVRKAKKAGPFTETAVDQMEREAAKVGLSLEDAVRYCIGAGWQGFNAGWWSNREGLGQQRSAAPGNKHAAAAAAIFDMDDSVVIDA